MSNPVVSPPADHVIAEEAGHAIASVALGMPMHRVTVIPGPGYHGLVQHEDLPLPAAGVDADAEFEARQAEIVQQVGELPDADRVTVARCLAVIKLAGPAAAAAWEGRQTLYVGNDVDEAVALLMVVRDDRHAAEVEALTLWAELRAMFDRPEAAGPLRTVGGALRRVGTLSGQQVHELVSDERAALDQLFRPLVTEPHTMDTAS